LSPVEMRTLFPETYGEIRILSGFLSLDDSSSSIVSQKFLMS